MLNPRYQACIEACSNCALVCETCAASCLREEDVQMMARCIELDRDCADLCALAALLMTRDSEQAQALCKLCPGVPGVRRRMRQAPGRSLPSLRASLPALCRGVRAYGCLAGGHAACRWQAYRADAGSVSGLSGDSSAAPLKGWLVARQVSSAKGSSGE